MYCRLHAMARVPLCLLCSLVLFAALLAGPAAGQSAAPIDFGHLVSGSITLPSQLDAYTFAAQPGDCILISMTRTSGDLWPRIRLYDSGGKLLGEYSNYPHAEVSLVLPPNRHTDLYLPLTLWRAGPQGITASLSHSVVKQGLSPATSTYTIIASSGFDGRKVGDYNLYLQRLNPPAGAQPISFGQTLPGAIDQIAKMDAYTFDANPGDQLFVGMSRASGEMWSEIRLFGPDGTLLERAGNYPHVEVSHSVATGGSYGLLVNAGFNGTLTGTYDIFVQRTNEPGLATAISSGQVLTGTIALPAQMNTYTFDAAAGNTVLISMTRVTGNQWSDIRLYGPDGLLLDQYSNSPHAEITLQLAKSGQHTILAGGGFNGTLTGTYDITLQVLPLAQAE